MSVERDWWYEGEATHAGVAAAFRAVRPGGAEALKDRLRAECTRLLGKAHRAPPALVEVVLASGDVELQLALAEAEFAGTAALCALARLGRPELGRAVCTFRRNDWDGAEVMAAVMAAADPTDPGWRAPDGLVPWLVEGDHVFRHELLYTPFGEVLAATLVRIGSRMPPDLLLDRVRGLRELVGPAEFADFVRRAREEEDELGHPGLLARIDEEPAGPPGPTGLWLLATGRARTERGSTVIDWDLVRAEQVRNPWPAPVLTRLVMEPDCPEDLVREAYRHDRAATARLAHRLPDDLSVDPELEHDPKWWPEFIRRRQRCGWLSVERVLAEIAPAVDALRCLDADEPGNRRAIAELVAPLGADRAAWAAVYTRLGAYGGSSAALVTDVLAARTVSGAGPDDIARGDVVPVGVTPDHLARDATHAGSPGSPGSPASADAARAGFLTLFRAVPQHVRDALVPDLDLPTLRDVLASPSTNAATRARITAVHGRRVYLARAMCAEQVPESVEELLDLDDPDVNAVLFRDAPLTDAQRVRVLAGVDRHGERGAVPTTDDLLETLSRLSLIELKRRLMTGLFSGDPRVVRLILRRTRVHTAAAASRMLVAIWERGGADAVRALLDDVTPPARQGRTAAPPFDAEVARYVRGALAEPDGLDRMRRYAATAGDPAHVVAEIRRGSDAIRYLTDEGIPIPWPELVAARAVRPLTLGPVDALVQRPDCPREILLDGLRFRPNAYTGRASWVRDSIERGTLTVRDISAHCAPAGMALMLTMGVPITKDPQEHERWIVRDLRAAGAIDRLGDSVQTWTIAIRMLPEFPGTLLELLDTVAAIVAVGQ
ncbi:hypothetical protein ACIBSV_08150 [Embleya sp. NPDC050154]|uniref:hypothetical protein n=1 Tax=Embleya sp. NPDC050154 TaxID=3363988 RepID=UPI0037B65C52